MLVNEFHVKPSTIVDIVVCGGGHAGIEAALIAARLNYKVVLITLDIKAIGRMSCNPAIGGLAKGQIVREIDVLGGIMGLATDYSGIQYKILNKSKGKSVWSPRAQVDKRQYENYVSKKVLHHKNITIMQGEVVDLIINGDVVSGVVLRNNEKVYSKTTILTCGTFLNGLIHIGQKKIRAGRMGESSAEGITESLVRLGFNSGRLKTGTPPRLDSNSINWDKTKINSGDDNPIPFSYRSTDFSPPNVPCHSIQTSKECKTIIEKNLNLSPMFSGDVTGVGPRYCPSIEDKIHRFKHHDSHTLFLEPEWMNSKQIYLNGFSTSLPEHIQVKSLRSIVGLEKVKFFRPGYAIEYDFFLPSQLKSSLETKKISGLFFAGQINGTSGYEEASAQGLMAGINATKYIEQQKPLVLRRDEAYIGVLIDDLITKDTLEPYRMYTSRAEYRILLRFSNAHTRLKTITLENKLLPKKDIDKITAAENIITELMIDLEEKVNIKEILYPLERKKLPLKTILKRPEVKIDSLKDKYLRRTIKKHNHSPHLEESLIETEALIKYEGYIDRQLKQVQKLKKQEYLKIPKSIQYGKLKSISNEGREKLEIVKPETLGQAMRISGLTPVDISILALTITDKKFHVKQ